MLQYSLSIKLSCCQRAPKTFCYTIQNLFFSQPLDIVEGECLISYFVSFQFCGWTNLINLISPSQQSEDFLFYNKTISRFYKTHVSLMVKLQGVSDNRTKSCQESLCLESSNKLPVGFPSLVTCGKR